ncbi:MAG: hypothetical protein ACOYNY_27515 [Caldilineaceae bacterium]
MSANSVEITMLGPSQVGKTSMLAAMYYVFDKEISARTHLRLEADVTTEARLQDRVKELMSVPEVISSGGGVARTDEAHTYTFELETTQHIISPVSMELVLHDFPGGWMEKRPTEVINRLQRCSTALVAIDTPALMAEGNWSFLHDKHNAPNLVARMFKEAYSDLETPKLVIFVPVRCERWVQESSYSADELLQRVEEGYKRAFEVLSSHEELITVVIAPIQTIGSISFSRLSSMSDVDGKPTPSNYQFVFEKNDSGDFWSPQHCEQPLRWALRFELARLVWIYRNQSSLKGLVDFVGGIADLFGWNTFHKDLGNILLDFFEGSVDFRDAVDSFAEGCLSDSPFKIVQGHHLLEVE